MKNSPHVFGSPFDEVQKVVFAFALGMQEDIIFRQLYSEPATKDAAISYLITSPKMHEQQPN